MNWIQSTQNTKVKNWRKLSTKKEREKSKTYLVESFHLVEEALKNKNIVREIIISDGVDLPSNLDISNVEMYMVSEEIAKSLAETETTQGIFAVCEIDKNNDKVPEGKSYLLLDGVQDPGNVGTIIRTADAAGIETVILGDGCADLFNSKVLRSAQGSHFHVNIVRASLLPTIQTLKENGVKVFGTSLENGVDYRNIDQPSAYALLVGNEGQGVSKDILNETDQNLFIPIYGRSESLNVAVATGILTYHFQHSLFFNKNN
jgi:TrmH family RNA methyltransferase